MAKRVVIEVVDNETGEVVKTIDVTSRSDREVEKIDSGLNINMNHERYFTRIVKVTECLDGR
jgi:uncharacterized FlaG/YvyC family protein